MSADHARELCKANGGYALVLSGAHDCALIPVPARRVVTAISGRVDYVVIGAGGPRKDMNTGDAPFLTERAFLNMILPEDESPVNAGQKRTADEPLAGPSKKVARKSDPGPGQSDAEARAYQQITNFLYGGEIRLEGKGLKAFDCGGQVYKAQRGKSAQDLLLKFGTWLDACDGVRPFSLFPKSYLQRHDALIRNIFLICEAGSPSSKGGNGIHLYPI